jgi:lipopolysaccharide/colanic/teichoic acid biosynthesis glycosyltransferase
METIVGVERELPNLEIPSLLFHGVAMVQVREASGPPVESAAYERPLNLRVEKTVARPIYEAFKRILDAIVAMLMLLILLPLMAVVALAVKLSSPGPIFFRQRRLKRGGRQFWCYKFRTMVPDAEAALRRMPDLLAEFQIGFKLTNDPRITPIGGFLRRTCLDELPQLINVLRGDISMIGPRPIVPTEIAKYGLYGNKLLSVTPGLGGLWQACRCDETTYRQRVAMDMAYIDNRNMLLDIRLLGATALGVVHGRGAK